MKSFSLYLGLILAGCVSLVTLSHSASLTGEVCTMEYNPVCAYVQPQCLTLPCPMTYTTFSNACVAKSAGAKTVTAGACKGSSSPNITPKQMLQNGVWILESINNKPVSSTGTLQFTKKSFNAKLCNNISGQYSVTKTTLILRKVMSKRMYCEGELMPIESILTQLPRVTFTVSATSLIIKTKNGDVMVWRK